MVDLGVAFAGDDLPGVDLIMPDLAFIEKAKKDLVGLIITHAHEDHIGALAELWPRLGVQVYMTRFAAGLAEARRLGEPGAPKIPIEVVAAGRAHRHRARSTSSSSPSRIRFPKAARWRSARPPGLVVHTGDWKIDPTPLRRLRHRRGALARRSAKRACWRWSAIPPTCCARAKARRRRDVAKSLAELVGEAKGRVVVTTFASNVARLRAAAEAGLANGRQVMVIGRAMERVDRGRARMRLSRRPAAVPRPGSVRAHAARQGAGAGDRQPGRAARRARAHRRGRAPERRASARGDIVIFSSRTIPGNEKAVGKIINGLVTQGVEVVTDRTHLVHVSGHPRRAELAKMYAWLKPKIAVPAHGEPLHLTEHVAFAKAQGVSEVVRAFNGDVVRPRRGRGGRRRRRSSTAAATRTATFCCRRATIASASAASSPSPASSRSRSR